MADARNCLTPVPGEEPYSNPASVSSSSQEYCNSPNPGEGSSTPKLTLKGIEQAKKRLRAFSIQKKLPVVTAARSIPVKTSGGSQTVVIGKLAGVKTIQKSVIDPEAEGKKMPKPPKPGCNSQGSYSRLQQRTLGEIEDMKRKMELVELGIPLGLINPNSDRAMPTGAMPPIKAFLTTAQIEEILQESRKAKEEGKKFTFDYKKILPEYDNPFQNKKRLAENERKREKAEVEAEKRERKASNDKYPSKRYDNPDRDRRPIRNESSKYRHYSGEKYDKRHPKYKPIHDHDRYKEKERSVPLEKEKKSSPDPKNTSKLYLDEFLVCDSWSLDKEDNKSDGGEFDKDTAKCDTPVKVEKEKEEVVKEINENLVESPAVLKESPKLKLQPVSDDINYEISGDEIDIFDEKADLESFAKPTLKKTESFYFEKDPQIEDSQISDSFLESVINEIKDLSGDENDKSFLSYDESPEGKSRSATPDLSKRSDSRKSVDSCKSVESGYKSTESPYKVDDKKGDYDISKSTLESLEIWTFVLKVCQPLLFRHDENKCYRSTTTSPKLWYTENPKQCSCVQDRSVVYDELNAIKMSLVDRVYGCDQISESPIQGQRGWYPKLEKCLKETIIRLSTSWEDDSSQASETNRKERKGTEDRAIEKEDENEMSLDKAYQRFMDAVRTSESKTTASETSRGNTPTTVQKKKTQRKKETDDRKKKKTDRVRVEDWSQESEVENEVKSVKKKRKNRKRKQTSSSSSDSSDSDASTIKRRRISKDKRSKKIKSQQRKRKLEEKKKKQKKNKRKKRQTESESRKRIKAKKRLKEKRRRKYSSSSSSETEEERERSNKKKEADNFDVNILNNIKTERITDDEKIELQEFSPRRSYYPQKEIINVRELQNHLVAIKQEAIEEVRSKEIPQEEKKEVPIEEVVVKEPLPKPPEPVPPPDLNQLLEPTNNLVPTPVEKPDLDRNEFFGDTDHGADVLDDGNEYEYRQSYDEFDATYFDKSDGQDSTVQSIEVVKLSGSRGEIKCDWRAGVDVPRHNTTKPSRWGLKPGEANIVLTGECDAQVYPIKSVLDNNTNTYKIETISSTRSIKENNDTSYDEAYADMYGESDLLQYGDCFSEQMPAPQSGPARLSLDDRIDKVLRDTANINQETEDKASHAKGALAKELNRSRQNKRVSFADGYKPGQDSDTEKPPKKRSKLSRVGCSWPCPASHPDHVPLWDALPPPPPPTDPYPLPIPLPHNNALLHKFDARSLPGVLPPEVLPNIMPFP